MFDSSNELDSDLLWKNISELPYFRGFLRAIEGRFYKELHLDQPVLDLGCGDGHFGARTFEKLCVLGIDPSYKIIRKANSYHFYTNLICCLGKNLPFRSGSYQTIISNSVLEHISDVDAVIVEVFKVLEKSGRFIISVPNENFSSYLSIALFFDRLGLSKFARYYRKWFNFISRHYHVESTITWNKRLEKAGFKIIQSFEYFPPKFLMILEWGHYLGLPALINKLFTGRWVLFPSKRNLCLRVLYSFLKGHYEKKPISEKGAYTFIIAQK